MGGAVRGGFHQGQCSQLQQMTLHKITHCTSLLIKGHAALDAQLLCRNNLNTFNKILVPGVFEQRVALAEKHDVLRHFLGHVVIDMKYLFVIKVAGDTAEQIFGRIQI